MDHQAELTRTAGPVMAGGHPVRRSSWIIDIVAATVLLSMFWVLPLLEAQDRQVVVAGAGLGLLTVVAVLTRWRFPVAAPATVFVTTLAGWVLQVNSDPMLALAWCLYPLALRRGSRDRAVGGILVGVLVLCALTVGTPSSAIIAERVVLATVVVGGLWILAQAEAQRLAAVQNAARRQAAYERAAQQAAMAREVHDVVGHTLGVISAEADVSRTVPGLEEADLRQSLHRIEQRARDALQEVQALVRTLREGDPDPMSVTPIPQLVASAGATGLRMETDLDVEIPQTLQPVVSRVVQEALSNVVRHAHATRCHVTLTRHKDQLRILVEDDGAGLSAGHEPGIGLTGLRERVDSVGGTVTLTNRPTGGTRLAVTIPLQGQS